MPRVPHIPIRNQLPPLSWRVEDVPQARQPKALWDMVQQYKGHPVLMDWAGDLIRACDVQPRDPPGLARAVQRYAQDHIRFFREDPERFVSALRTLQWGFGDCDDKSIFIATVLNSFRIPTRLVFIRYAFRRTDGEIKRVSHVYPEAQLGGRWVALESVHPWPMGKSPLIEARRKGYKPKVEIIGP